MKSETHRSSPRAGKRKDLRLLGALDDGSPQRGMTKSLKLSGIWCNLDASGLFRVASVFPNNGAKLYVEAMQSMT